MGVIMVLLTVAILVIGLLLFSALEDPVWVTSLLVLAGVGVLYLLFVHMELTTIVLLFVAILMVGLLFVVVHSVPSLVRVFLVLVGTGVLSWGLHMYAELRWEHALGTAFVVMVALAGVGLWVQSHRGGESRALTLRD